MIWTTAAALLLASLFVGGGQAEELPEYIHVCPKSHPQLSQCMANSIESLKPKLAEGIQELNVPSLEPLKLGDLLLGGNNQNGLIITARDVDAFGASNFKIKRLEVVEYGRLYKFLLHLPHLYVSGDYNIAGRILLLPITGEGKFRGNFTACRADVVMHTAPRDMPNGERHVRVTDLSIKVRVGGGSLLLDNLFNGDKTLGDVINDTINQNFNIISKDIIPLIEKALEKHFKKTANKIMNRYTEAQIFPMS